MLDLHFHCLPGVDDGPRGLEEAVAMCRRAWEDGCRELVATPHQGHARWPNQDPPRLRQLLEELDRRLDGRPVVHLGGEIRLGSELIEDLEDPRRRGFLPLAGSRYLLLEFPRGESLSRPEDSLHELVVAGWRPILAHPEFYPDLVDDPELCSSLIDLGALFQVTAMSVTGGFGRRARAAALSLIDDGLVHFVASDAHGVERRPPGLAEARRVLTVRHGQGMAHRLTWDNPLSVVRDEPIDASQPAATTTASP